MASLREQLQEIYDAHGKLTPALVVEAARPEEHPMHGRFEWNDAVAGEKYREVQARELIKSVRVTYRKDDRTEDLRFFVSVEREGERAYHPADEIARDEILSEIVLREMERDWRELQSRYGHFKEFAALVRESLGEAAAA